MLSMESKTSPVSVSVSRSKFVGHVNTASTCLEREDVEVWNSGLLYKSMARPSDGSWPHVEDIAVASVVTANPQLRVANGGLNTPVCIGAAITTPVNAPLQGPLKAPFMESRVYPLPKEVDQLHSGLSFPSKGEFCSDDVICHTLKPCYAQADKFEVQLSETCQRRFVMFDHSGSKKRIIFHPAMVNEFPTLLSSSPHNVGNYLDHLQDVSARAVSHMKAALVSSPPLADFAPIGARLPTYWRSELLARNFCLGPQSFTSKVADDSPLASCRAGVDVGSQGSHQGNPDCSNDSHENTEDLEALLSSDDEMSSTGHSPSDLTWNNAPTFSENNSRGYSSCSGKKRKRGVKGCTEDDTDSTATSGNVIFKETSCNHPDILGRDSGYGKEGLTVFDLSFPDELSSSSSANNQRQRKKPLSELQRPVNRSRKEKIKNTFRLLRGIIPGGESMDTAYVLDEAIHYVRTLQGEVQKLEAKKLT